MLLDSLSNFDIVCNYFNLSGTEDGEISLHCPFHNDKNQSASLNLLKGKFYCHACRKAHSTIENLAKDLSQISNQEIQEIVQPSVQNINLNPSELRDLGLQFLESRGFLDHERITGISFHVNTDSNSPLNGYLLMYSQIYGDRYVGRNLLDNNNPKYYNSSGQKGIFFLDTYSPDADHIWLVEGILDAISLNVLGISQVGAILGSTCKEQDLYEIKHQTAFLLFDDDWAGFSGARKVAKSLQQMGGNPVIINLSRIIGNDPNDAYMRDPEAFYSWLNSQVIEYSKNDREYIDKFLKDQSPLQLIPTTLPLLDHYLGGGFKDGVVIIGAEPGVGKTSFATWFSAIAAKNFSKRILYITYEISKRQVWARLAAIASGSTWDVLEMTPNKIKEQQEQYWIENLSEFIRVAVGWSINKIKYVVNQYDVIIVDYLQRMPSKPGEDNEDRTNVSFNIRELSNIARDQQKVVIVISSLSRAGYGKLNLSVFKESGDIEYAVQVAIALIPHVKTEGSENIIDCHILKNTRGREGIVYLRPDLGHQIFEEAEPYGGNYQ